MLIVISLILYLFVSWVFGRTLDSFQSYVYHSEPAQLDSVLDNKQKWLLRLVYLSMIGVVFSVLYVLLSELGVL